MLGKVIANFQNAIRSFGGDEPLMAAAVSAAALMITVDGEITEEEIDAAMKDLTSEPTLHNKYTSGFLANELRQAIERACTYAGQGDNLAMVSAISNRSLEERNNIFLIAADVAAAHKGIGPAEDLLLSDFANRLGVDKEALKISADAQRFITGSGLDLEKPPANSSEL